MTKQEAQNKVNEIVAARAKQAKIDRFVNENGDGYYSTKGDDTLNSYIKTVHANGLYVTADLKVIDADDFAEYRNAFNDAVRAAGSNINLRAIEKQIGMTRSELASAKEMFVA